MGRVALVATYLGAGAFSVICFNANVAYQLELAAVAAWALSSILLGWGTGQPLWALLVVLVVAFAQPFGAQDPPIYHDAVSVVFVTSVYGAGSVGLIVVSALARIIVDGRRSAPSR